MSSESLCADSDSWGSLDGRGLWLDRPTLFRRCLHGSGLRSTGWWRWFCHFSWCLWVRASLTQKYPLSFDCSQQAYWQLLSTRHQVTHVSEWHQAQARPWCHQTLSWSFAVQGSRYAYGSRPLLAFSIFLFRSFVAQLWAQRFLALHVLCVSRVSHWLKD